MSLFDFVTDSAVIDSVYRLFPHAQELTPAQQARLLVEAKARYEAKYPWTMKGAAQGEALKRKHGKLGPKSGVSFVDYVVDRAVGQRGWKHSSVSAAIARATKIHPDVLSQVESGKRFNTKDHLDRLSRVATKEEQLAVLELWGTPEVRLPPTGETFEEGGAVLDCGDCKLRMNEMLAAGETANLVLVDPPYGIQRNVRGLGVMEGDEAGSLWAVEPMAKLLAPSGYLALWTAERTLAQWAQAITLAGLQIYQVVQWRKPNLPEYIAVEYLIVAGHATCCRFELECNTLPNNHALRELHQSPKPPELMETIIEALCPAGGLVADFFAGTCPVGVAAVRLGRRYVGVEISPTHFATGRDQLFAAVVEERAFLALPAAAHGQAPETLALAA